MLFSKQSMLSDFITGKVMVHEWGHLRWGLFDEYWHKGQDKRFSNFYFDSEENIAATRCGKSLKGTLNVSQTYLKG